jgi:hypothetical protein
MLCREGYATRAGAVVTIGDAPIESEDVGQPDVEERVIRTRVDERNEPRAAGAVPESGRDQG